MIRRKPACSCCICTPALTLVQWRHQRLHGPLYSGPSLCLPSASSACIVGTALLRFSATARATAAPGHCRAIVSTAGSAVGLGAAAPASGAALQSTSQAGDNGQALAQAGQGRGKVRAAGSMGNCQHDQGGWPRQGARGRVPRSCFAWVVCVCVRQRDFLRRVLGPRLPRTAATAAPR